MAEARNQAGLNRITADREHDWYCRCGRLRSECRRGTADRSNHRNFALDKVGGQGLQALIIALCPAVFDQDVAAFDKTSCIESLMEGWHDEDHIARREATEKPDHRHCRLLRP